MMMKRVLGVMLLALLACGPGADTPTAKPARSARSAKPAKPARSAKPAEQDLGALRDSFVWRDASQPAHDWDADLEACKGRVGEDPSVRKEAHPLVRVAAFMKCMDETGWEFKGKNR
jgi:hypothetical protein